MGRNGITWSFGSDYQVGQYVTGDWWVLDSGSGVKVNSVSPSPSGSGSSKQNGSVINPSGNSQGYDGRVYNFSSSLSISYPVTLHTGDSLVSTKSNTSSQNEPDITGYSVAPDNAYLQSAAVLTVVSSVPAQGSFRPTYIGTNKVTYNTSMLQRQLLLKLPLNSKPSLSYLNNVTNYFANPWLDHLQGWTARAMHPLSNMPNYGREVGISVSQAACLLSLDYTDSQLEPLLDNFVQLGIDLYATSQTGRSWPADGGHENGRKWAILFAGIMLDNNAMKSVKSEFGEDDQTYYGVTPSKNSGQAYVAYWGRDCVSSYQDSGCSGSGTKDCRAQTHDKDGCQDYRNCCTSYTWVGYALVAQLMNQKSIWNHDAFFDYVDRWMGYGNDPQVGPGTYINAGSTGESFIADMWNQYRSQAGGGTQPPANQPPIANAGPDQNVIDTDNNGTEQVTLNGSLSTDSDGTISSYIWKENNTQIASGQKPSINLTAGQQIITLTVTDNNGATDTDTVTITVSAGDSTPPNIVSVSSSDNLVKISFNESLNVSSAENLSNYAIDNSVSISKATYSSSDKAVTLTTSNYVENVGYILTVKNVSDLSGNKMPQTNESYTYSSSLVGYWKFNYTTGQTVEDLSGIGNNASLVNGPTWTGDGQLQFDGVNDAVQIPTKGWNVNSGTISVGAYLDSLDAVRYLLGHTIGTWSNRIQLYLESGRLCIGLGDAHYLSADVTSLSLNTWYYITLTWNGSAYSVYVNGQEVTSGTYTGLTSLSSFADIGNDGSTSARNESLDGKVSVTRVYNRQLSSSEVHDIYNLDRPFLFNPIGNKEVDEGSTLAFNIVPLNPDVVISIQDDNLPNSCVFKNNSFSWTPTYDNAGTYTVTFVADDGTMKDMETISVKVDNIDRAPVFDSIGNKTISENETLTVQLSASDLDGDKLTYSAQNLPSGAVFNNSVFQWTPQTGQAGIYNVTFTVSDGNLQDSQNLTITVTQGNTPPPSDTETIIIDNGHAGTSYSGTWGISGGSSSYGSESLWSRDGSWYKWSFTPSFSGSYNVSMWWTSYSSRASSIPVNIETAGGLSTVYINQQQNGGQWNSLGSFVFKAGVTYSITITSQPDPASTCADAVKLIYQPDTNPPPPASESIIIDNGQAGTSYTGKWAVSAGTGSYGRDALWSRDGTTYTWTFVPSFSGSYDISLWWTQYASRANKIPVKIQYASGTSTVYINQQLNGGRWNSLGSFVFQAGKSYNVTITSQQDPTSTCADAARITYIP